MDQITGQVKVMVGGRGDKTLNRSLNRASNDIARQPGSSIKPLAVYGPALIQEHIHLHLLLMMLLIIIQELMPSLLLTLQKVNTEV